MRLERADLSYCLLVLFRTITENKHLHSELLQRYSTKLVAALFFFLACLEVQYLEKDQAVLRAAGWIVDFIQTYGLSFGVELLKTLTVVLRKNNCDIQRIAKLIQKGTASILGLGWSLDRELEWCWRCKTIWELLGI